MNVFRWLQGCLTSALVFFWGPYLYHLYILARNGVIFAFTGTYWTLMLAASFFTVVCIRYVRHPFGLVGSIFMEFIYGWLSYSIWAPPIVWWKNRVLGVGALVWGISCMMGVVLGIYLIKRRKRYILDWAFSWRKLEGLAIALSVCISFFWWSYGGFGTRITMEEPTSHGPAYFKVSFWGLPRGSINAWEYDLPAMEAELAAYQKLNTTFYAGITKAMLDSPEVRGNLTAIVRTLAIWNLHVVVNVQPLADDGTADTVGYFNLDQAEAVATQVLAWREGEKLWNIEGLCFDAETPRIKSKQPDYETYYSGVTRMTLLIDQIQRNNASLKVTVFIPAARVWDLPVDADADLDFLAMTASNPPTNWDRWGVKTTRSGPRFMSPYYTYMYQKYALEQYGQNTTVPVIGRAGEKNFAFTEGSSGFSEMMQDLFICKYLGVPEVIVDSALSFTATYTAGQNGSSRLTQVRTLLDAKVPISFPVTNDWDYYQNFTNMVLMGNWDSLFADVDLYHDVLVTNGDIFTFLFVPTFSGFLYLGIKEKRTPRKMRPSLIARFRERRMARNGPRPCMDAGERPPG